MKRTVILFVCIVVSTFFYYGLSSQRRQRSVFRFDPRGDPSIEDNIITILGADTEEFVSDPNAPRTPLWSWLCHKERCVRSAMRWQRVSAAAARAAAQAQLTCAMLCPPSPLWPEPTGQHLFSRSFFRLRDPPYTLSIACSPSQAVTDYLQQAFDLFNRDIQISKSKEMHGLPQQPVNRGLLVKIKVTVDPDPNLRLNTSEAYKLLVSADANNTSIARIVADSFCGARHGLETLAQLIWFDEYVGTLVIFQSAYVDDRPKFAYRGLMLDTARNYFQVEDILRTLDAMAATKLNTFHWHATDSQSFPLKLKSVPQFAWFGAYSRREVYTPEDIQRVVHRARIRGIRVVIEIDGPAHVGRAWSWAEDINLGTFTTCVEAQPWRAHCGEPPCGQLNPNNSRVYSLLRQVFTEILQLTGVRDVFHIGGDEVSPSCWNNTRVENLWMYYINETKNALKNANGGELPEVTILWSSDLTTYPYERFEDLVIQVWSGKRSAAHGAVAEAGLRVILSNVDAWYLDCGFGSWWGWGAGACRYNNERAVYGHRPWQQRSMRALGGEACLWSEQAAGATADGRLWARGAALGERLWADPRRALHAPAFHRLDLHARRLRARNIAAGRLWPRWCTDNPYQCGSYRSLFASHPPHYPHVHSSKEES